MTNKSKSKQLRNQLRNHYANQQLSERQLAQLQQLSRPHRYSKYLLTGAFAACFVLLIAGYIYQVNHHNISTISREIAYNHNSRMQMEVLSPELQTVQGRLNRLGFQLVASNKLEKGKWQLIGGRYCNINGKIAAQMQLRHAESKAIYTYYQAKVPRDFINQLNDNETAIDGVKIKLWREKGLLMGLAF